MFNGIWYVLGQVLCLLGLVPVGPLWDDEDDE